MDSISEASSVAEAEKRHLILLYGSRVSGQTGGCMVPRDSLEVQLQHILDHFGILVDPGLMASRCAECNANKFRLASAAEVASELHASTVERYSAPRLHLVPTALEVLVPTSLPMKVV